MRGDRYGGLPGTAAGYGEAFWRVHHEAWKRSDLNQREYCEAQSPSLKAFGNWRTKFKAEPQPVPRKLLYRRGGVSHTLSHTPSHRQSHTLSHVTYPSSELPVPVVLPALAGRTPADAYAAAQPVDMMDKAHALAHISTSSTTAGRHDKQDSGSVIRERNTP
jgi:hypothetical protein